MREDPAAIDLAPGGEPPCSADVFEGGEPDDAMLARLVRNLADAVVVVDRDGVIVLWNSAATGIFGWTTLEAAGKTFELIVPVLARGRRRIAFERVMTGGEASGSGRVLRGTALHQDGRALRVAWTVTLLREPAHRRAHGVAVVIRHDSRVGGPDAGGPGHA